MHDCTELVLVCAARVLRVDWLGGEGAEAALEGERLLRLKRHLRRLGRALSMQEGAITAGEQASAQLASVVRVGDASRALTERVSEKWRTER